MNDWLARMGQWVIDRELPYHKPEIWGEPAPHPAHIEFQAQWLRYVEQAISPNFPPFSPSETDSINKSE